MSVDLTGINNVNDFFTSHYLATYFDENVKEAAATWKELEESKGVKSPASGLRATANQYLKALPEYESEASAEQQMRSVSDMARSILLALGYGNPVNAKIELDDLEIPVFHEETNATGKPILWVLLSNNKDMDTDVLGAHVFDANTLSEPNDDIDNEALIGRLLFVAAEPPRFLIVASMTELVLVDRNKWNEKRCMLFDLKTIFSRKEDATLRAVAALLCKPSMCPAEGDLLLDRMDKKSRDNASEVSDRLKYALRECIELLGNEVIFDWINNKGNNLKESPIDAGELTIECLRYMYRMLFLLFIEARPELGFAPMKSDVYAKAYSLESLREIEEALRESLDDDRESNYLDQTLDGLCHHVYNGYPEDEEEYRKLINSNSTHDVFVMPPLKAHIFDDERTPLITNARLRDCVMLRVIDLMSIAPAQGRRDRAERISYGTLGINQLGAVYEALLSYRGFIAQETLFEVKRAGDKLNLLDVGYFVKENELENYTEDERVRNNDGTLRRYEAGTFVYRLAGREREKSASYYTPECLTQCLVKYALKELLEGKTADEILDLTICEPAMGSAAFLNEAVSQLAEAYLDRRQKELGEQISHDERELKLQRVKMFIADRNIYGVDLNPIAVELGEVSLWLNSISKDGFVPWFGNQLHNGNSLIGARRRGYTERALTSKAAGIRWYDTEPERIGYETGCSKSHRVYHFLAFDPGMALYKDKAVKGLEPEAMGAISDWNKKLKNPYTKEEVQALRHLSLTVDKLWEKQIQQQRKMRAETRDSLSVYGHSESEMVSKTSIRQKDAIYSKYYLSEHERNAGPFARLKFAMDYWCALWFWPIDKADELPTRDEFLMDMSLILEGTVGAALGVTAAKTYQTAIIFDDPSLNDPVQRRLDELQDEFDLGGEVDIDGLCQRFSRLATARDVAGKQHFFHWELEFADVFEARGGFDLIIGNPPWIKLGWKEQNVLADIDPRFAVKKMNAATASNQRGTALRSDFARMLYLSEYVSMEASKNFYGASQNYRILAGQKTNLYKCFLPQAWEHTSRGGVSAFVHPEGHFDDSAAGPFRAELYPRLRKHFQFENEHNLFTGTNDHGRMRFSLNVYGDKAESVHFESISNLYEPSTIDECYSNVRHTDTNGIDTPGIKDSFGNWNTKGHPNRIVEITNQDLKIIASVFGEDRELETCLPVIHSTELLGVLAKFTSHANSIGDYAPYSSMLLNETNQMKDGTFTPVCNFPREASDSIYSAPFIGVGNPLLQGVRSVYKSNNDYDFIDLELIPEDYLVRTKYQRDCTRAEFEAKIPKLANGNSFDSVYRVAFRNMVGCSSERTLQAAILPPGQTWINKKKTSKYNLLVFIAGCMASLPYDYFLRASGKTDVTTKVIYALPVPETVLYQEIICRALLLNCLTKDYTDLWTSCWDDDYVDFTWTKTDHRLDTRAFSNLTDCWEWATPLRTDYERRQALVELDVLVSMALGLTLEQLETVYRLDFSVLQSYENDTWYDHNGRIAFSKKSLGASKPSRQDFERSRSTQRDIEVTFTDDTLPGGPRERTVRYEAPFDSCDRIADYRQAWEFFSNKYSIGDKK